MPALRPCLDCNRLTRDGSRCRRCQRARRGTGGSQQAYRRLVLREQGEACAVCGSTEGVEVHHLHPIGEGGDRRGPGVPLCGGCHRLTHASR
jgi:5-methylcytosine-specific restriction endonuclease McrA